MDTGVGKRLQDQSEALSQAKAMLDGVMASVALDGSVPERVNPADSASKSVGAEIDGIAQKIGSLRTDVQHVAQLMGDGAKDATKSHDGMPLPPPPPTHDKSGDLEFARWQMEEMRRENEALRAELERAKLERFSAANRRYGLRDRLGVNSSDIRGLVRDRRGADDDAAPATASRQARGGDDHPSRSPPPAVWQHHSIGTDRDDDSDMAQTARRALHIDDLEEEDELASAERARPSLSAAGVVSARDRDAILLQLARFQRRRLGPAHDGALTKADKAVGRALRSHRRDGGALRPLARAGRERCASPRRLHSPSPGKRTLSLEKTREASRQPARFAGSPRREQPPSPAGRSRPFGGLLDRCRTGALDPRTRIQ